ncbi:MAG: hypothetical protein Q7K35_00695 [bacterium]|nr:hypothetical protein [bacterium]
MGINDLPGPGDGIKFRAKTGVRNFQRVFNRLTKRGDLRNLRDNREEIVDVAKQYERVIKIKGGLNRLQKRDAWLKIKAGDTEVTKNDKREIKQILNHLGRGAASKEEKVPEGFKEVKTSDGKNQVVEKDVKLIKSSDGKSFLTEGQIKRNLNRTRWDRLGEHEATDGNSVYTETYAGGVKVKSYGLRHGTKEDIGIINKNKTGFAGDYNKNSKLPNNPAPRAPLGGVRPIGL